MNSGARAGAFYVDDFEPRTAFGVGHPRGAQVLRALAAVFDVVQVCPMTGLLGDTAPDESLPSNVRPTHRSLSAPRSPCPRSTRCRRRSAAWR